MRKNLAMSGALFVTLILTACDVNDPDEEIGSVNEFLVRVCQLAAPCPDVSATPQEIEDCPEGIRSELSEAQLAELEQFTTYTQSRQTCILECIGGDICGRFGESISNISDADVVEPFRACELECRS
jgi:hypothetical protein